MLLPGIEGRQSPKPCCHPHQGHAKTIQLSPPGNESETLVLFCERNLFVANWNCIQLQIYRSSTSVVTVREGASPLSSWLFRGLKKKL